VKRYLEAKDRAVLPPFVSRAIVVRLWALLGVLLACGAITSLAIIRFLAHE
jgi:LPS O-antigen subunit length determinant protein (WzzB/FepE family)